MGMELLTRANPFTGGGSTSSTQTGCLHLRALRPFCSSPSIPLTEREKRPGSHLDPFITTEYVISLFIAAQKAQT